MDGTPRTATVADEQAGQRLDRFLTGALPELSRSRLQALLASGAVSRAGETIGDGNTRVKPGEVYVVRVPKPAPAQPQAQRIPLTVVYEDTDLIVIDKPVGLVVHPAAGNPDGTLVNALIAYCGASLAGVGGVARPGIVHRLDKDTSGLMVAAKNDRAMASLAKQFAARTIERAYHAVTWGAPRAGDGIIEGDIGRNPFDRKRMAIVRHQGKPARTRYRLMERYGSEARAFASLIECRLETGRTHQIRVHLAHLGHPLIGDSVYGRARKPPRPKSETEQIAYAAAAEFPRQALHAWLLGFQHPGTHKQMRFESQWPEDFSSLIAALRELNAQ
ncbi:RluA family pseudouridine synthase [Bradyrhizobium sp.]|uniref:RluA family pseudouridine synthase n=1 Tax=Bradyrhizobium sp. TaxID=376 RepID=UPI001ED1B1CB|nr:RluA family pseudouridine synthase [Bradyrhizobium sp.]MBV9979020.1 RluA family pseudouridine synthase [Bradyrhizobium sp.]